jgi:hypothetical protein
MNTQPMPSNAQLGPDLDFDSDELAEIDQYAQEGAINLWVASE